MIRAYIRENLPAMALEIAIIQLLDDAPRRILRLDETGADTVYRWEDLPDPPLDVAPTLQLGDSEARALLEALAGHYNGADDVRALRRDYDAERSRVDSLTSALTDIARQLAEPASAAPQYHVTVPPPESLEGEARSAAAAMRLGNT